MVELKDFKLDKNGDIVIEKHDIVFITEENLLLQKIKQVLSTNKGEWYQNKEEGLNRHEILKKNPNYDLIKDYIRIALKQINPELELKECTFKILEKRALQIDFKVTKNEKELSAQIKI